MGIKEIAYKAHVSVTTVSLALNGRKGVSEKTRKLIKEIAIEEGYRIPSQRVIESGTQGIIVFAQISSHKKILNKNQHHFIMDYISGIQNALNNTRFSLEIVSLHIAELNFFIEKSNHSNVKGLIILGTELEKDDIELLSQLKAPFVIIDTYFDTVKAHFIDMNNIQGVFQAIDYCVKKGHKNIKMVTSSISTGNIEMRERGFLYALETHHLNMKDIFIYVEPGFLGAYNEMLHFLDSHTPLPSLLFCYNDIAAYGVIKALRERDINVPEDISIVGFDDIVITAMMEPHLSTVQVATHEIGKRAFITLIDLILNKNQSEYITKFVSTTFVSRGSIKDIYDKEVSNNE